MWGMISPLIRKLMSSGGLDEQNLGGNYVLLQ